MTSRLTEFHHDGLRFDVSDAGPIDGELIIALHGFPQRASSWSAVIPLLSAAGYRVLAPDQRGYSPGASPSEVEAYRLDRLADDVLALADAAGVDRFNLLGHDWGGGVAWYVAARNPERLLTLSVVSVPHPRAMIESMRGPQVLRSWYMAWFQLPWLPEVMLAAGHGSLARRMLAATRSVRPQDGVRLLSDPAKARGPINWYRALRLPTSVPIGKITVPALYVWSDQDAAMGGKGALLTARWVSGPFRFEILTGVSHWIPEERPADLARFVLDWIA